MGQTYVWIEQYGQQYAWHCECGSYGRSTPIKAEAERHAREHERRYH